MAKKEVVAVYIDGGNTYQRLKEISIPETLKRYSVDLVIGAVDHLYDTAIVISSDTDLIPAILYVRYKKKKVEYVGFSAKPSMGMIANSEVRRLLTTQELENFLT